MIRFAAIATMAKGKRVRKRRRDEIMTCRKPRNKLKHGVKVKIHNHGIWGELEPVRCWEGVGMNGNTV